MRAVLEYRYRDSMADTPNHIGNVSDTIRLSCYCDFHLIGEYELENKWDRR